MGSAEGERGLAAGAEVGFEGVPNAGVSLRQVVLKRTCIVVRTDATCNCNSKGGAYQSSRTHLEMGFQLMQSTLQFRIRR